MCVRWLATVRSPRNSAAATSRFVRPSATSAATRRSAAVSPSSRVRPPMRPSSARALLDPAWPRRAARSRRAPPRSRRGPARFCRARLRTMPSASSARARPNGIADRLVLRDRLLEERRGLVDVALRRRRRDRGSASRARAPTRGRAARASASQTSRSRTASSIRPSSSSSLDVVGASTSGCSARPTRAPRPAGRPAEPRRGRGRVSAPERDEPEDRQVLRRVEPELLLGQLERALRMLARELELAAMDGDERDREVVLRHLEPVLDRDVVRARGVVGRELPAPGPELDPGEAPERAGAPRLVALAPLSVLALEQRAGLVPPRRRRERVRRRPASPPAPAASPPTAVAKSCARAGRCAGASASPTNQPRIACTARARVAQRVVVELVGELERRTGVLERRT